MRKNNLVILCLILAWCVPAHTTFAEVAVPHISVIGFAEKMVKPDQITWSVYVHNTGAELKTVATAHAEMVSDVIGFLEKAGVKADHIQTSRMRFGENWRYKNNARVKEGYFATTDISFKIFDIEKYYPLWMGLAAKSGVSVRNAEYGVSDRRAHQTEVRKAALLDAREKAQAMAKVLGGNLAEPLIIEEDYFNGQDPGPREALPAKAAYDAAGGSGAVRAAPGKIPIRIRVKTVFRFVNPR